MSLILTFVIYLIFIPTRLVVDNGEKYTKKIKPLKRRDYSELEKAITLGFNAICITADFEVDRTFYITRDIKIITNSKIGVTISHALKTSSQLKYTITASKIKDNIKYNLMNKTLTVLFDYIFIC